MSIIVTRDLTKKYKDLTAVDRINLAVEAGECFGLLGPNGAGKTSLTRLITGVSPPSSGEVWIEGKELKTHARELKARIGVVFQEDNLDQDLSVLQNLTTFARYFDIPRKEAERRSLEVLKLFELDGKLKNNLRELSGGMKRRLLIARGLINQPRILVLDEPTSGLDPQARHLVWQKIRELKAQGVTQILSTQNMEEASILCDRLAIMHQGKILSLGTPEDLIRRHVGQEVWEVQVDSEDRSHILRELNRRKLDFEDTPEDILVFHVESREPLGGLVASSEGLRHRPATLEDVFLRLTGRKLNE
ncbi:MAG: ABC transporter ATP-binding protein [Chloroflexota bacterium]